GIRLSHSKLIVDGYVSMNSQCSTFVMGHLLVHTLSSADPKFVGVIPDFNGDVLPRIWPATSGDLTWPPVRPVNDAEVEHIADAFMSIIKKNTRKVFGTLAR